MDPHNYDEHCCIVKKTTVFVDFLSQRENARLKRNILLDARQLTIRFGSVKEETRHFFWEK